MKLTKKSIYIIISIVVLVGAAILFFWRPNKPGYSYIEVKRGDVIQEVSVTGRVKSAEEVNLAFERGGKVVKINADVGDKVYKDQLLMQLDNSELAAQLAGAEANLKAQKAKLEELKKGTRPEEIRVQEVTAANARVSLEDAKKALVDKLTDAFTKSDDAVRNQVDQFINNPKSQNPELAFVLSDDQLKNDIQWKRYAMETRLNNWKDLVDGLGINSDLDSITAITNENLNETKLFLDKIALAVNGLTATASLSQTTINTYKSGVTTARTNVSAAISNLSAAHESYRTAESVLILEENKLALKKAGTIPEQIAAQEAQVEKMKADIDNCKAQIAKTILRSPIDGVITGQNAKIGEIILANTTIVSVISDKQYEVEVNIPEADIAKVKINDFAKITLDAYGEGVVFNAHVVSIDPAETMVEGVATYKTTLQFDKKEDAVKSGMTANIDILTDKREGVLYVSYRAVVTEDGNKFVLVDSGKATPEEKEVKTGIKGSDGNIEIISGLSEGEKIIDAAALR